MNLRLPHLPDDFYESHPVLRTIQRAARADQTSPDAVLLAAIGRAAATIPIPATVNGSSVNMIGALVGHSGSGKSTSHETVCRLIPELPADALDGISVGSGEGIVQAYMGKSKNDDGTNTMIRNVVTFYVDEGEQLLKLAGREGSTTLEIIRSAWSGASCGMTNATAERTRRLAKGTYRFVMTIGLQPTFAAAMLLDQHAGTPQRFLFAAAGDPCAPVSPPSWPGTLELATIPAVPFAVDPDVMRTIRERRHRALVAGGHVDPYDTHEGLIQMRLAAILAYLLDGRSVVMPADWTTAALIVENSRNVRTELIRYDQQTGNDGRVASRVDWLESDDLAKSAVHDKRVERISANVLTYLRKHGTANWSQVRKSLASRDRQTALTDDVQNYLIDAGLMTHDDEYNYRAT